ncbi:MAG: efflux transporter periplasmic adaptor subunit, partial [Pseudomonadota bacterium]
SRASAGVGEAQTGRLVFARLDTAVGFRPGDFVTVQVQEPPLDKVVRLPASAVDAAGTVLVLGEDERLEQIDVQVLRRQGDDVLVRSADIIGRDVVEARSPLLGAGIKVRPLRPDAAAAEEPEMLELTDERRARLVAFVEGNQRMPAEAKARVLARLAEARVPARMVARLESRMGG